MKSNEDNKTWISNILVRNIFLCLKQVYCCLTFVCVYIYTSCVWLTATNQKCFVRYWHSERLHMGSCIVTMLFRVLVDTQLFRHSAACHFKSWSMIWKVSPDFFHQATSKLKTVHFSILYNIQCKKKSGTQNFLFMLTMVLLSFCPCKLVYIVFGTTPWKNW